MLDSIRKDRSYEYFRDKSTGNYLKYDRFTEEFAAFNDKEINSYFVRARDDVDKQIKDGRFEKLDSNPSKF